MPKNQGKIVIFLLNTYKIDDFGHFLPPPAKNPQKRGSILADQPKTIGRSPSFLAIFSISRGTPLVFWKNGGYPPFLGPRSSAFPRILGEIAQFSQFLAKNWKKGLFLARYRPPKEGCLGPVFPGKQDPFWVRITQKIVQNQGKLPVFPYIWTFFFLAGTFLDQTPLVIISIGIFGQKSLCHSQFHWSPPIPPLKALLRPIRPLHCTTRNITTNI